MFFRNYAKRTCQTQGFFMTLHFGSSATGFRAAKSGSRPFALKQEQVQTFKKFSSSDYSVSLRYDLRTYWLISYFSWTSQGLEPSYDRLPEIGNKRKTLLPSASPYWTDWPRQSHESGQGVGRFHFTPSRTSARNRLAYSGSLQVSAPYFGARY